MARQSRTIALLESLNIFGLSRLDPVILAALADEEPLLLIGPHGTAKSELLNRIAEALGLSHRHYNASLISFDDLLGYPVPNVERSALEYLRTPGNIWGAESVFLDEISRCRPEHQNKLFSILHERKIQGLPLEQLRYRWAAMNPPLSDDCEESELDAYVGSLPLDPALADRFPYVLVVSAFDELTAATRLKLIARGGQQPKPRTDLAELVEKTRKLRKLVVKRGQTWIAKYVNELVLPLRDAGLPISARRGVRLAGMIASVHASLQVLGLDAPLEDAACLTLKSALPQRALGQKVQESKLQAVHRLAVKAVGTEQDPAWDAIFRQRDPVRKVALALAAPARVVNKLDLTQLVTDAYASLTLPRRYILAGVLLPALAREDRVTAATYGLLSEPLDKIARFATESEHNINRPRVYAKDWDRVLEAISFLQRKQHPRTVELGNTFYTLFSVEEVDFDPVELIELHDQWAALFEPFAEGRQDVSLEEAS